MNAVSAGLGLGLIWAAVICITAYVFGGVLPAIGVVATLGVVVLIIAMVREHRERKEWGG